MTHNEYKMYAKDMQELLALFGGNINKKIHFEDGEYGFKVFSIFDKGKVTGFGPMLYGIINSFDDVGNSDSDEFLLSDVHQLRAFKSILEQEINLDKGAE